jgi:UDP-glucose:(heptosyl)LPS alpha-1,3-glucosyltransferase
MGMGWYCDVFESHDGSRVAAWHRTLGALPAYLRPIKRAAVRVLPRYTEFTRLMDRQFGDPNRLLLALSWMVARDYERYHAVPAERIRVIHNGVDTKRFSPDHRAAHRELVRRQLGVGDEHLLALFVGHDYRRKGLATAIAAVNRMAAAGDPIRLAVVGGKKSHPRSLTAQGAGPSDTVVFLGPVRDVRPYYAAADVFVLPSFSDPCSLSVLEAAASGLPSITTYANGAGELLTEGKNGFLLHDPADDKVLANRLRVFFDRSRARQMGAAAHEMALRHTLESNCDRILALYDEIIRGGRNRLRPRLAAA